MDEQMVEWIEMYVWIKKWIDGRMDGWMNGGMDGWMYGCMD